MKSLDLWFMLGEEVTGEAMNRAAMMFAILTRTTARRHDIETNAKPYAEIHRPQYVGIHNPRIAADTSPPH
jgi:hypothetical protein